VVEPPIARPDAAILRRNVDVKQTPKNQRRRATPKRWADREQPRSSSWSSTLKRLALVAASIALLVGAFFITQKLIEDASNRETNVAGNKHDPKEMQIEADVRAIATSMTIVDVLILLVVAAVCGILAQAISGYSRGGLIVAIVLGFIGAMFGAWIAGAFRLPKIFSINVDGHAFPVVWSIIGGTLFSAIIGALTRRRAYY
jgi:uncharacterized membrane protein YeaQ/YmgE (transglycosylase-associated protein family)